MSAFHAWFSISNNILAATVAHGSKLALALHPSQICWFICALPLTESLQSA